MTDRPATWMMTNARIVLPESVIERGWLAIDGDSIAEFGEGRARSAERTWTAIW